jgi:uncharacterized protein
MRRQEKEISAEEVRIFLKNMLVGVLSLSDGGKPYAIPLNYFYDSDEDCIYFHGAGVGRKNDIIKANPRACFTVYCLYDLVDDETPCKIGARYTSAIAYGEIIAVSDQAEKKRALEAMVKEITGKVTNIPIEAAQKTNVFKLKIEELTGKADKK